MLSALSLQHRAIGLFGIQIPELQFADNCHYTGDSGRAAGDRARVLVLMSAEPGLFRKQHSRPQRNQSDREDAAQPELGQVLRAEAAE